MINPKNFGQKSLCYLFVLLLIFLLIFNASHFVIFHPRFYYHQLGQVSGATATTKLVLDYYQSQSPEELELKLGQIFQPEEVVHLWEVRQLINSLQSWRNFLLFFFSFFFLFFLFFLQLNNKEQFLAFFLKKTVFFGWLLLSIFLLSLFFFSFFFTQFHRLFFQTQWVFPADSLLVQIFPQSLFFYIFSLIIFFFFLQLLLLFLLSFFIDKRL